jgi:hypothetical protein
MVLDVVQDAVDAVADADVFFEGLDVDIGGAIFERLHEHVGAELDDGSIIAAGEGPPILRLSPPMTASLP